MTTMVIRVDLPPRGALETSGNGSAPTSAQMAEEEALRDEFVAGVSPTLSALLGRPLRRSGNVSHVELLGTPVWSELQHYLIFLEVDVGDPPLDLDALVPRGAAVEVVGHYRSIHSWPGEPDRPPQTRSALRGSNATTKETTMTTPATTGSMPCAPWNPWDPGLRYWPQFTTVAPPVATRGVLSPADFGNGTADGAGTPGPRDDVDERGTITDADKATLARIREVVAQSRTAIAGTDTAAAASATQRLVLVLGYLTGFFDGKRIHTGTGSGFGSLFPAPAPATIDEVLVQITAHLDELTTTGTRFLGLGILDALERLVVAGIDWVTAQIPTE